MTMSFNRKYQFDKIKKIRTCSICEETKPFSEFPVINRDKEQYRPECKRCWAKKEYQRMLSKKIEKEPNKYHQCDNDDCCYISTIGKWSHNKWHCPNCGTAREGWQQ